MNKMEDLNYKAKICNSIGLIEGAIEDLTETEMKVVVCVALSKVLVDKGLCPLAVKQFYAELAVGAIDSTDMAYRIYKR